jgi:hypothetical protein
VSTGTTNGRDRYRLDEDDLGAVDAALREAARDTDSVEACAAAAAEAVGESDPARLQLRAYQIDLFEPDWPSHVSREDVERVASDVETVREVAEDLRLSRKKAKRVLRWAGESDAVERTTMSSVLKRVRKGDLDGQIGGDA